MTEHYQLNNLEIDEISLVDKGANEGATIVLMKRDDEANDDIAKRLADVEIEKAALVEKMELQEWAQKARELWPNLLGSDEIKARVLKHIDSNDSATSEALLQFFKAADAAIAHALIEKGVNTTVDTASQTEEETLHQWASDYAAQNNLSLPIAKKRLVSENTEAAALFKRVLARVQRRHDN